jgi:hypothetical protein
MLKNMIFLRKIVKGLTKRLNDRGPIKKGQEGKNVNLHPTPNFWQKAFHFYICRSDHFKFVFATDNIIIIKDLIIKSNCMV